MCVPGGMWSRDPGVRDDPRVGAGQLLRVANRPGQRHDEQQQRDGSKRTHPSCQRSERRHERKHVAVEVRAQRHQVGEVDDDEGRQDQVGARAADESRDEADRADDQRRAEPVPEPVDESDRRRVIVLEAEPALPCEPLHAERLVPRLSAVDEDERARRDEGDGGEADRESEARPLLPPCDDERHEQEHARILEAGRQTLRRGPRARAGPAPSARARPRRRASAGRPSPLRASTQRAPCTPRRPPLQRRRRRACRTRGARATRRRRSPATDSTTPTMRAVRYDGSCCHSWNGALTYMSRLG